MRIWHWLALFVLLFSLPWTTALTQNAANEAGFAVLQGVVKFTDGTPYRGAAVVIKMGGKEMTPAIVTDENGIFTRILPVGEATVTVAGAEKTVKLVANEQTTVTFEVKQTGVTLTIAYPDKSVPSGLNVSAAYRAPDKRQEGINGIQMTPGRFWFKDIPANATALSVIARSYTGSGSTPQRQQWTFEKAEELRVLTMTIDKPLSVTLLVVDAAGAPVTNTRVKGTMSYPSASLPFWDPEGGAPRSTSTARQTFEKSTDANGLLDIGAWAVQPYEITMRTDEAGGAALTIQLTANTPQPIKYALNLQPRDLTQTVFGSDGRAVPNAQVNISYSWKGAVVFGKATADAKGKVVWKGLPPVRAIVWGKGVPAGVIPAEAATVDAPLPAPTTDNNRYLGFSVKLANIGDAPVQIYHFQSRVPDTPYLQERTYNPNGDSLSLSGNAGSVFTFFVMTKTYPPKVALLSSAYLPYAEENERGTLTLELQDGAMLAGKIGTKQGPVGELNQFRVVPVQLDDEFPTLSEDSLRRLNFMRPVLNPDGSFQVALPAPGKYRLIVDLYDEATQPVPELLFDVARDNKPVNVVLPDPLLKVPAGAELSWTTRLAPKSQRRMVATAGSNPMPVFGPKDQLLACWFRPTPDKLTIWNGVDQQQQQLSLRSVAITVQDQEGNPYRNSLQLQPLLPINNNRGAFDNSGRASSETNGVLLGNETTYCQAIWTGKYQLSSDNVLPLLEIPATGPRDIVVKIDANAARGRQNRYVKTKYTRGDVEQLRKNGSERITLLYDKGTLDYSNSFSVWNLQNDGQLYNVPPTAKTVTLYWPGVGYMRDLTLPADTETVLELPAWNTGTSVTGKIVQPDGTPYAGKQLTIVPGIDTQSTLRLTTDAQGSFTVKGLLPGPLFVFTSMQQTAGWTVDVPEKGLTELTLRMSDAPIRFYGNDARMVWWFPDGGKPVLLPVMRYNSSGFHDVPTGSGWIWTVGSNPDSSRYFRVTIQGGDRSGREISSYGNSGNATGPTIGILLPPEAADGLSRTIILTSLDPNWPVVVPIQGNWQASTLLNRSLFQLNAVPPGKYRLAVETAAGTLEKEITVTNFGTAVDFSTPGR